MQAPKAPTTLAELSEVVRGVGPKACAPGTVLDLRDHELGGPLPGGSTDLVLGVLGLVLRNGTLELPKGACVSVAAADVRLEELRFTGEGQEGEKILGDGYANVAGLVVAEGVGCSMALHR